MKRITLLSTFCFLLLTLAVNAQTPPNAFNYSAVARNAAGQPIATATIGIQVTILKTSPAGASQYSENHIVNTDDFGLFNLVIGAGAVQSGSMATIDWSIDNYYLQVGMDAAGGTNFLTMGTTQLLSVPYALHAKTADSLTNGITISSISTNSDTLYLSNGQTFAAGGNSGGSSGGVGFFTHFIGEEFGGGVIYHLWKDDAGVEHGLILDLVDLSTSQVWSNITDAIGITAQTGDGLSNSIAIVSQAGHTNSAAALCLNSTNGGQTDWFLPSHQELQPLKDNWLIVNNSLLQIAGATTLPLISSGIFYWASTEYNYSNLLAWNFKLEGGMLYGGRVDYTEIDKNTPARVRAIRTF
jgi:hypothetical protein